MIIVFEKVIRNNNDIIIIIIIIIIVVVTSWNEKYKHTYDRCYFICQRLYLLDIRNTCKMTDRNLYMHTVVSRVNHW